MSNKVSAEYCRVRTRCNIGLAEFVVEMTTDYS